MDRVALATSSCSHSKKARAGRFDLFFLDECGFSPTQPTGYSWSRRGVRRAVRYEAPKGRRVNALVAYGLRQGDKTLLFTVKPRTLTSDDVVMFLRGLPSHLASTAWVGARDAHGALIASARAVGDRVKSAWIYDVIVTPAWRGRGLGLRVVRLLMDHPAVRGTRRLHIKTRDAQSIYRKLGFVDESEMPPQGFTSSTMCLDRSRGG